MIDTFCVAEVRACLTSGESSTTLTFAKGITHFGRAFHKLVAGHADVQIPRPGQHLKESPDWVFGPVHILYGRQSFEFDIVYKRPAPALG